MMTAFTQKKLKLSGNMGIAMKLNQVFSSVASARGKTTTTSTPKPPPPATTSRSTNQGSLTSTTTKHKSGKFFEDVQAKLVQDGPSLVTKVKAIIGFDITCPNNETISYVIDLQNGSGAVKVNDGSRKCFYFSFILLLKFHFSIIRY